jgi:exodeoxyribonuclease VII large subunit
MPHSMTIKSNVFTLLQVTQNIQNVVNQVFKTGFWVKAEVNKLNFYAHSGHCFPELVEKTNG